jgi:hypothetical protein
LGFYSQVSKPDRGRPAALVFMYNMAEKAAWKAKKGKPGKETQGGKQALIMKTSGSQKVESASREPASQLPASRLIDARIQELADWRGEMLSRLRVLIKQADPQVVEECKWVKPSNPWGVPVWSHNGIICTGETYKGAVKLTFAKGAFLDDPAGLFNSSLEGRVRRAIDFREGDKVNEKALKDLIRVAVALNTSKG